MPMNRKPIWGGNKKAITDPSQPSIPAREPKESESEHRLVILFYFLELYKKVSEQ